MSFSKQLLRIALILKLQTSVEHTAHTNLAIGLGASEGFLMSTST